MSKIYCDIADLENIKKFSKKKIVKGFTTNPSLMRKAGAKNYLNYCSKILNIIKNKPVSFEVFADDEKNIINQAKKIKELGKNVFVKIPIVNSKGKFLGRVINQLNKDKIKLNITAVYSSKQTYNILKNVDKKTSIIISIFAGRMADVGKDPLPEFKKSLKYAKYYKNVKILWASTREPYNYLQSKKIGCDIITIPPNIIEKIEKFGKSFDKLTLDTVNGFLIDSKKSKFSI
tara:strand:+ start:17480 stop:18175 length:696 start_codon:yes stop_codon:yes gene_type:complete